MNKLSFISSIPSDNDTTIYLVPTNSQKSLQFFNVELNMHFYDLSGNSRLTIPVNANDDGVYFKLSQLSSLGLGTYAFYLSMRYSDHMEYYPSNTAKYITLAYSNNRLVFKSIFTPEATNITPPDTSKIVERQVLHVHDIDIKDIKVSTIDSNKNANVYLDQYDVLHFDIPKGETGKSLYELARDAGFNGSFKDYEKTLVGPTGPKGDRGYNIWFDIHDYGENYRGSYWSDLKGSAPDRGPQVSDLVVLSSGHLVQVTGVSYGGVPEAGGGTFNYGPYLANLAGVAGPKGDKGETGPQGPQGVKGDTGSQGPQGVAGKDGHSIWQNTQHYGPNQKLQWFKDLINASASNPPKVNDTMINADGNMAMITNVNITNDPSTGGGTFDYGSWIGNIKGPQGPAGPKGDTGNVGPQGPKGEKGDSGFYHYTVDLTDTKYNRNKWYYVESNGNSFGSLGSLSYFSLEAPLGIGVNVPYGNHITRRDHGYYFDACARQTVLYGQGGWGHYDYHRIIVLDDEMNYIRDGKRLLTFAVPSDNNLNYAFYARGGLKINIASDVSGLTWTPHTDTFVENDITIPVLDNAPDPREVGLLDDLTFWALPMSQLKQQMRSSSVWFNKNAYGGNLQGKWWSDLYNTKVGFGPQVGDLIIQTNGMITQVTAVNASGDASTGGGTFDMGDVIGNMQGHTPVRGTDYWTDADKNEIKSYVDDAILNGKW
jgi:hypothetical protein